MTIARARRRLPPAGPPRNGERRLLPARATFSPAASVSRALWRGRSATTKPVCVVVSSLFMISGWTATKVDGSADGEQERARSVFGARRKVAFAMRSVPRPNTPPLRAVLRLVHTYADWSSFPLPCSTKLQRTARRLTDWRFRSRTNAEGFPMEHLTNANTTHTG